MARIAGVELPKAKRMEVALTYVYGIGRSSAVDILHEAKVDAGRRRLPMSALRLMDSGSSLPDFLPLTLL